MMTTKKIEKKEIDKENNSELTRYFYSVGRRKTSIAKVKIFPIEGAHNTFSINGKKIEEYFTIGCHRDLIKAPLALVGQDIKFDVQVKVTGGGVNSQAEALRMGISRALVSHNGEIKKSLKDKGFLTRDPREVERKKPGLKKARKAPQWAKR